MKANEAPEKLYVELCSDGVYAHTREWENSDNIEYVRTDAFIEKAVKWLKQFITNNAECNRIISKKGVITMGLLIEGFKNYMKGE